ncbi:Hsp20/alpha crystallin family protein [Methanolobus bombayensis]|uniref:Hsp20/alpha crystallin family protein n=1 Tax=Methanolobus bombayensis TaxID=38023 RepID=UPI001AE2F5C5|nr:Hsp20/alpha crystallin family protein [Methanolobus bombayensis]MBP1910163.1 HSP20 family protein [Methanolobus bombayensis]
MADKRKKRGFFDDIFIEGSFTDIEDIIDQMIEKFGLNFDDFEKQPFFYGFSVSRHPGEEPEIREFGNVFSDDEDEDEEAESIIQQFRVNDRKLLMDVFEIDDRVHVTIEIPDVEKEDIGLNVTETLLELSAENEEMMYEESIDLPTSVDPDSAKARYHNGVLEVIMDIKELGVARSVHID